MSGRLGECTCVCEYRSNEEIASVVACDGELQSLSPIGSGNVSSSAEMTECHMDPSGPSDIAYSCIKATLVSQSCTTALPAIYPHVYGLERDAPQLAAHPPQVKTRSGVNRHIHCEPPPGSLWPRRQPPRLWHFLGGPIPLAHACPSADSASSGGLSPGSGGDLIVGTRWCCSLC